MEALENFTESVNDALQEIQTALNRSDTKTNNGRNSFTFSLARVRIVTTSGALNVNNAYSGGVAAACTIR